jgi:glycosyltransferase involved in cell wall biosynthesis
MSKNLKVSVIVPVWNDAKRIIKCVEALKNQTMSLEHYEIIVVDNGSTDETYEVVSGLEGIIPLQESEPGSYAARNAALDIAKGEYVAFTDADCIPDSNWVESLVVCAEESPNFGVIAGEVKFFKHPDDNVENAAIAYESLFSMNQKAYALQGVCITANWLSKREVILNHGGFNSRVKSGGDHEMANRLTKSGLDVIYCPQALVLHPARNYTEILKKRRRVIGGTWDKTESSTKALKLIWQAIKLYIKRTFIIIGSNKISLGQKFSVFRVISSIFFVSMSEIFKLSSGHQSTRS